MGAIHSYTIGLYNNNKNKKSHIIQQQKTLTLNPDPHPGFCHIKLENYGVNDTPDKNSSQTFCRPDALPVLLKLKAVKGWFSSCSVETYMYVDIST